MGICSVYVEMRQFHGLTHLPGDEITAMALRLAGWRSPEGRAEFVAAYDATGHLFHIEQAEWVDARILRFLAGNVDSEL